MSMNVRYTNRLCRAEFRFVGPVPNCCRGSCLISLCASLSAGTEKGEVRTAAGRDKYHLHYEIRWNTFSKRKIWTNQIWTVEYTNRNNNRVRRAVDFITNTQLPERFCDVSTEAPPPIIFGTGRNFLCGFHWTVGRQNWISTMDSWWLCNFEPEIKIAAINQKKFITTYKSWLMHKLATRFQGPSPHFCGRGTHQNWC